jgi:putative oxidoreductase
MHYLFKTGLYLFALTLVVFGVQHFMYAPYISPMVPHWIPWSLFWTYFVGVALIAAAAGIAINKMARLACILLGFMLFLFVILIDIPPIIAHFDPSRVTDTFKEIGLGSCAFILSSAFPKKV